MEEEFILFDDNIISITKPTLDKLLKEDDRANLISLYVFYDYTAKWQKTTIIKSTTNYTANGLNWTTERVQKHKKQLVELGLIEEVVRRNEKNQITGYYIKVNYVLWKHHLLENPGTGLSQGLADQGGNSLITNSLNALSTSNERLEELRNSSNPMLFEANNIEATTSLNQSSDNMKIHPTTDRDKLHVQSKSKKDFIIFVPKSVEKIIQFWNASSDLPKTHEPKKNEFGQFINPTRTYRDTITRVRQVLMGKLFHNTELKEKNRKFTVTEILYAIENMRKRLSPDYMPKNKNGLKIALFHFFYNPYASSYKSLFLDCLEASVVCKDSIGVVLDTNPEMTASFKDVYIEKVLMGQRRKFTPIEENKFIKGTHMICEAMNNLQARMFTYWTPEKWCEVVIEAIKQKFPDKNVTIGHLCSEYTYSTILVDYLTNLRYIEKKERPYYENYHPVPKNILI